MTSPRSCSRAFTLVELLLVLAIVGLLIGLAVPEFNRFLDRSRSTACLSNLRAIGVAVRHYINDNDSTFPIIETNPADPIYPDEVEARGLLDTLQPYGLTATMLRCPADVRAKNHFAQRGTSYEWRPLIDDEPALNPILYTRRGERRVNPGRVRLVIDIDAVHNGRNNQLFADGRVRGF